MSDNFLKDIVPDPNEPDLEKINDGAKALVSGAITLFLFNFTGPVTQFATSVGSNVATNYLERLFSKKESTGNLFNTTTKAFIATTNELKTTWENFALSEGLDRSEIERGKLNLEQLGKDVSDFLHRGFANYSNINNINDLLTNPSQQKQSAKNILNSFITNFTRFDNEAFIRFIDETVIDSWIISIRNEIFNNKDNNPEWKQLQYLLHINQMQLNEHSFNLVIHRIESVRNMTHEQINDMSQLLTDLTTAMMHEIAKTNLIIQKLQEDVTTVANPYKYSTENRWIPSSEILANRQYTLRFIEADSLFQSGLIELKTDNLTNARDYFLKSMGICDYLEYVSGTFFCLMRLSELHARENNFSSAERYITRIQVIVNRLGDEYVVKVNHWISELERKKLSS